MAKKKNHTKKEEEIFEPDLQLITHKYSDYYISDTNNFVWYDTKEVFYPVYKSIVRYKTTKEQEIHPIIIGILNIIKYLETLKNVDILEKLQKITQLDTEIFGSIINDLDIQGYIKDDSGIKLTDKGRDALKKEKEKIVENTSAFVAIDGIFNKILDSSKTAKEIFLENKPTKNSIELKPLFKARPRTETLYNEFSENKTLYQTLLEGLQGLDNTNENKVEVNDILEVQDTRKFFKKYICLFYKNKEAEEKILAIDDKYEIDAKATELFDKLIETQTFNPTNEESKAYKDNVDKYNKLTHEKIEERLKPIKPEIDLTEGKTLEMDEHKKYFFHVLDKAKKQICIQSPWVRYNVVEIYKNKIESALKRGVKIFIKYSSPQDGFKAKNRFEKVEKIDIDKESKNYFNSLSSKFQENFSVKASKEFNHSKILICDNEFMIMGSFNWLSFGGETRKNEQLREETSNINRNKESIIKEVNKFVNI